MEFIAFGYDKLRWHRVLTYSSLYFKDGFFLYKKSMESMISINKRGGRMNKLLMTPGPTNIPNRTLIAMTDCVMHHRSDEYTKLFGEYNQRLKRLFNTKNPVLTFPAAGSGGLESAVVNMFSKGDKVLFLSCGVFGDRFAQIGDIYGLEVDKIKAKQGFGIDIETIEEHLKEDHKAVVITHNETSTGVTNDIEKIGKYLKDKDKLFIVDAVSSLGAVEIKMDEWGIDVLVTGSQKALMSPPGLTLVGLSQKALKACEESDLPKFYFDYKKANDYYQKDQNPYTPAISLIVALNESIKMMEEEGIENVYKRHQRAADICRREVERLGLEFFTDENYKSDTITSIAFNDDGIATKVKAMMEDEYRIIIAGGQGQLKGKIIRIGHMGMIDEKTIRHTMKCLGETLEKLTNGK